MKPRQMPVMWHHAVIATVLIAGLVTRASAEGSPKFHEVTKLQVGVKHRPGICERKAAKGDIVEVHYTGWLVNGTQFTSTVGEEPFKFHMGEGEVVEGWELGIAGMCVGEKRRLKIPASLGYMDKGHKDLGVPPGASMFFDAKLMSIEDGPLVIWANAGDSIQLPEDL